MSERWSICTEYMYCANCARIFRDAVETVCDFSQPGRGLAKFKTDRIVAAFAGGVGAMDCAAEMAELKRALDVKLCHEVRYIAFYETSTELFRSGSRRDA